MPLRIPMPLHILCLFANLKDTCECVRPVWVTNECSMSHITYVGKNIWKKKIPIGKTCHVIFKIRIKIKSVLLLSNTTENKNDGTSSPVIFVINIKIKMGGKIAVICRSFVKSHSDARTQTQTRKHTYNSTYTPKPTSTFLSLSHSLSLCHTHTLHSRDGNTSQFVIFLLSHTPTHSDSCARAHTHTHTHSLSPSLSLSLSL